MKQFDIEINTFTSITQKEKIISLIMILGIVASRPLLLGNSYSEVGVALMGLCLLLILRLNQGIISLKNESKFYTFAACIIFFSYCIFQGVILNSNRLQIGFQTYIFLILSVSIFFIFFSNKNISIQFVRVIYFLLVFFSVSYFITLICITFLGWNATRLFIYNYGYFSNTEIFFPFTITYGDTWFNGIELRRLLGFSRESGIMQIFYIWGFFMADKYFRKTLMIKFLMIFGAFVCFSTAGFIAFGCSILLSTFLNINFKNIPIKRILSSLIIFGIVFYFLFFSSGTTSIQDKFRAGSRQASLTDRTEAIQYSLNNLGENPLFGVGFYSAGNGVQAGINLLSTLGQIGIIGLLLWIIIYICAFLESGNRKRFLEANTALIITAIFSQPLVFAPVIYWFLFSDYSDQKYFMNKSHTNI